MPKIRSAIYYYPKGGSQKLDSPSEELMLEVLASGGGEIQVKYLEPRGGEYARKRLLSDPAIKARFAMKVRKGTLVIRNVMFDYNPSK
jgi:hypothetical protein